ncbi:TIGR02186 family protein [Albidovulum sp.]|uniref:TIGR02186 family protein n=1 Tax=Albidovulum sp. TaxID=1872424 RepID=UPI001DA4892F|nr:TIGR02186 family protein [Paracoccaceae bacterium]MCC0046945.1 TIGR02186 family protein [Defluviimonas sp.]HPE24581.1 TIGR02186 family protein [Albidovulum sp.]MCB2118591.1 TIGR02186 family protein [Paracoccaceae bacterium]MCB2122107.1 TIGR02186 family protein [Paracoccaceae bacterium]
MRWLSAIFLLACALPAAAQEEVVSGLSQDRISITANFEGSDLLVYGAVKREEPIPDTGLLQVIITVEGPSGPIIVRRKSRQFGIWVNTSSVEVDDAPSFYAVAATAPLEYVLSQTEDLRHKISVPQKIRSVGAPQDVMDSPAFTDALIRIRQREGLYASAESGTHLKEQTLFSATFDLPANLVEGNYTTRIYLLRNREVIAQSQSAIYVRKVGIERWLYTLARDHPALYGALALFLAGLAGWAASEAFRALRR